MYDKSMSCPTTRRIRSLAFHRPCLASGQPSITPNLKGASRIISPRPGTQRLSMASTTKSTPNPRIHVLGLGNLGRLYAHALATAPNAPPVTLLLHRASLLKEWRDAGQKIELAGVSDFLPDTPSTSTGYEVEVVEESESKKNSGKDVIQNLILATKVSDVVQALTPIAARLYPSSTIVFTQNGMPNLEEVSSRHFGAGKGTPAARPTYLTAVISHGLYSTGPFRSVLAGHANVSIGLAADGQHGRTTISPEAQYLINKITSAPLLNAEAVSKKELQIRQLQKLVINSTINPLSVIFRSRTNGQRKNGELFIHQPILRLLAMLVQEFYEFFRRASSKDSQNQDSTFRLDVTPAELEQHFSTSVLEEIVLAVAKKTAQNTSSMLQDIQANRETEIDYINGWFLRHLYPLEEHPLIRMQCNRRVVELVKSGQILIPDEICRFFELE